MNAKYQILFSVINKINLNQENIYRMRTHGIFLVQVWNFIFNPFLANVPILHRLKHQKTFGFLVFSGVIKWEHWPEIG